MGTGDKVKNAAESAKGKIKKETGRATDNDSLAGKGKAEEAAGNVKQAGENLKDAAKR